MKSLLVVFFGVFFALCSHGNPVFEFEEENSTSENPQQQAMKEQIGLDSAFTNLDIGIQRKYLGNEEGIMKGAENFIDSFMSRYFLTPEGKLYSNLKNAYFTLVLKFHAKKDAICAKFEEFHAFFSRNKASILNPNWMDENFDTWVGVQQAFLKETKPYFMVEGKTYQHLNQILKNNPLEMSFFSDSPSFDNYLFLFENFNFCIKWIESLGAYDDFGSILLLEKQDNLIREYRTKLDLIDGKSQNELYQEIFHTMIDIISYDYPRFDQKFAVFILGDLLLQTLSQFIVADKGNGLFADLQFLFYFFTELNFIERQKIEKIKSLTTQLKFLKPIIKINNGISFE